MALLTENSRQTLTTNNERKWTTRKLYCNLKKNARIVNVKSSSSNGSAIQTIFSNVLKMATNTIMNKGLIPWIGVYEGQVSNSQPLKRMWIMLAIRLMTEIWKYWRESKRFWPSTIKCPKRITQIWQMMDIIGIRWQKATILLWWSEFY